jgi:hypothetical protein
MSTKHTIKLANIYKVDDIGSFVLNGCIVA